MSGNLVPFSPGQAITLLAALTISSSSGGGRELVSKDLERESAALWFSPLSARPIADAGATFDTCCNAAWSVQPAGLRRFEAVRETSCNGASDYIYSGTHTGEYPFYAGVAFDFDLSAVPIGAKIDSVRVVICAAALPAEAKGELKGNISYWDPDRDGLTFFENDEGGASHLRSFASESVQPVQPLRCGNGSSPRFSSEHHRQDVDVNDAPLSVRRQRSGQSDLSARRHCLNRVVLHSSFRAPLRGWRIRRTCSPALPSPRSPPKSL